MITATAGTFAAAVIGCAGSKSHQCYHSICAHASISMCRCDKKPTPNKGEAGEAGGRTEWSDTHFLSLSPHYPKLHDHSAPFGLDFPRRWIYVCAPISDGLSVAAPPIGSLKLRNTAENQVWSPSATTQMTLPNLIYRHLPPEPVYHPWLPGTWRDFLQELNPLAVTTTFVHFLYLLVPESQRVRGKMEPFPSIHCAKVGG